MLRLAAAQDEVFLADPPGMAGREVIFEFRQVGGSVKVSAIDVATQVEIAVVVPAGAPEAAMRAQALRRLAFVLERRQRGEGRNQG